MILKCNQKIMMQCNCNFFFLGNQVNNPIVFIFLIHLSTWSAFFHWKLEKNGTFIPRLTYVLQEIKEYLNMISDFLSSHYFMAIFRLNSWSVLWIGILECGLKEVCD